MTRRSPAPETLIRDVPRWEDIIRGSESQAAFLDRAQGKLWDDYRGFIERCYQRFPESEKKDLAGKWRSAQADQATAAWLELQLSEMLYASGWTLTGHVPSGTGQRVDFRADQGQSSFFLEAHQVGPSKEQRARGERTDRLGSALSAADFGTARIAVQRLEVGAADLDAGPWVEQIREWLAEPERREGDRLTLRWDGWFLRISAHFGGVSGYPIRQSVMVWPASASFVIPGVHVLKPMLHKMNRYGTLSPLVLATAVNFFDRTQRDVLAALFGEPRVRPAESSGKVPIRDRCGGAWFAECEPVNQHVSGLLIVSRTTPGDFLRAEPEYWRNPFAAEPVETPCSAWRTVDVSADGTVEVTEPEQSLLELFDLPRDWGTAPPFESVAQWVEDTGRELAGPFAGT